ncbi:hypothetical protein LguiA_028761 [Lonicera macranthoides]
MAGVTLSMFSLKTKSQQQQGLPYYSPHGTRPNTPNSLSPTTTSTGRSVPLILSRRNNKLTEQVELDATYMGYETWLPNPPKLRKPRSVHNAASLAYIGDCVYELYARRHFLFPPLNIEEYNDRVMAVVRCEAQDALLQKLTRDNFLLKKERDILRWGKNVISAKTRTKRRAGVAVYNRASSLETLVNRSSIPDKQGTLGRGHAEVRLLGQLALLEYTTQPFEE